MTVRRYPGKNITKRNKKIGYVHRAPEPYVPGEGGGFNEYALTSKPYPLINTDSASVSLSYKGVTLARTAYDLGIESLDLSGDVVDGLLEQVHFPIDYTYLDDAAKNYEAMDIGGDVIAGHLGTTFYPREYLYRQDEDGSEFPFEALDIGGDIVAGALVVVAIDYYLLIPGGDDYESLDIAGDVVGGSLEVP